ncbi:MAG: T9SS type A sorting domain-containing protein [Bacteroidota bacterium]|nr:MAG: T9SS type A sorting domain-containing protein [Bacteroidota bacterium]
MSVFNLVTNEIINNAEIIITDISGKQISRMTKDIKYQYAVDVSTLPDGSYIITLKSEKKSKNWRLIKI